MCIRDKDTDFTVKGSVMKSAGWGAVFGEQETGGDEEAASLPPLQEMCIRDSSRMISPALYWVMTGDDFSPDINNPKEPKILVVGNNPDRQNIYSAALGLYNSRIVKLINKKGQLKSRCV